MNVGKNVGKMIGDFNINKANSRRELSTNHRINTLLNENTDFVVKEAYKIARTNIIYSLDSEKGCKTFLISSASPHEGKTTTCLNLAITFAQINARVLVIDADLRKPRIYRHLEIERENGLSDILCGLIDVKDAIKHCPKQNLDCITSGQIPPNPAELLSSSKMGDVIEELRKDYDYIFIDTPPVIVVTEAVAMARFASGVILVVRQNSTVHESIERTKEGLKLAGAKILGYILNDVDVASYGYSSYNKYGYSYSYSNSHRGRHGYSDKAPSHRLSKRRK